MFLDCLNVGMFVCMFQDCLDVSGMFECFWMVLDCLNVSGLFECFWIA